MHHQISISPEDPARIHIVYLAQVVGLQVICSTVAVDHQPHPPVLRSPLILEDLHVN